MPDADADHNEHDDAVQPMDDGDGAPAEGGSSNDEAPEPESSWGSLHIHGREPLKSIEILISLLKT